MSPEIPVIEEPEVEVREHTQFPLDLGFAAINSYETIKFKHFKMCLIDGCLHFTSLGPFPYTAAMHLPHPSVVSPAASQYNLDLYCAPAAFHLFAVHNEGVQQLHDHHNRNYHWHRSHRERDEAHR
ncbi:unnamed protein product [Vitrella brassicaformis CCMP3155]|uniref:Uncharacterized protein n=1 Tax=Vitrella brassicaformis (strain CCMP3155) TaxID=1169540 RepID=A0A0G4F9F4_VITBC|nr:unnamed protein product [Vitrella brassicaformis CCMP3155]|eukprot:CEM08881.1 unnamed protein product [Vitrella brassicaformis CCMP3155]